MTEAIEYEYHLNDKDPFNYKGLNRSDLMSLSSIGPKDVNWKRVKGLTTNRMSSENLSTTDIPGNFYLK